MEQNNFNLKKLAALRKENNLSLEKLGEIIGISNQSVSKLERGENVPSFKTLISLAEYFSVSLDYLVGRSDNPEIND